MLSAKRLLRIGIPLGAALLLACTGCATSKNDFISRKQAESTCDLTRLGRNKYFYSSHYQKRLGHSIRQIKKGRRD